MDERFRQSLLYDLYGELLNDHQKAVYSAAVFDDMSYSELADEFEVSRQAAFDLVRRINKKLENYEAKLGLMNRFLAARERIDSLTENIDNIEKITSNCNIDKKDRDNISGLLKDTEVKLKEVFDTF